jgi:hypothetical protein
MNNIFHNFYTEQEYKELSEYIETVLKKDPRYLKEHKLGRFLGLIQDKYISDSSIGKMPKEILDKTLGFANNYFAKDLYPFDIIFIRYQNDYDLKPVLPMHKDGGATEKYTIDFQYKANIEWPINIDGTNYQLLDNSILTFIGTQQSHGRDSKDFNDIDFVENIFFQFAEKRK